VGSVSGAGVIGALMAIVNLGFIAGALVNARVVHRFGIGPVIAYSAVLSPIMLLTIPAAPPSSPIPLLVVGGLAGTFLAFFANVNQLTLRQSITPHRLLGRMNAVTRFMYWGTIPIGSAVGGIVAQSIGLRETLFAAAIGSALGCVPIVLSPIRRLRELPEPPPEPALSIEPLIRATVGSDA
jgi:Bacterial protein of unknown function (DUF894).